MALTTEQCELLGVLLDQDASPPERTTADQAWQVQAWTPTDAARGAHQQWCRA